MRLFGLIGFPLSHSFSEKYFTEKFQRENITDAIYKSFPITDINLLPDLIKCHPNLHGFNVTIPYKEAIIPLLDEMDETAKAVGAVNTVLRQPSTELAQSAAEGLSLTNGSDQKWVGYNTDVYGFRQSINPFLASHHERALILGTGGAAKAVEFVLREIGVECIFVTRHLERSREAGSGKTFLRYADLNEHVMAMCKLIVNCSPVGMFPNLDSAPEIPYEFISKDHFLYDLVYNPAETEFLKRGKEKGAMVMNGMDMLKMQAEEAWRIWNKKDDIIS